MALIECQECSSSVSDRAPACVNCGFPIGEHLNDADEVKAAEQFAKDLGQNPDFSIGKQVANWTGSASVKLDADFTFGELGMLEPGKVQILRHKAGIKIINSLWAIDKGLDISFRQIAEIKQVPAEEIVREEKSVIGRGIIGGVLLGGSAAVVGALSGLDKTKLQKIMVTELYFLDLEVRRIRGIVFRGERNPSISFFNKVLSEKQ